MKADGVVGTRAGCGVPHDPSADTLRYYDGPDPDGTPTGSLTAFSEALDRTPEWVIANLGGGWDELSDLVPVDDQHAGARLFATGSPVQALVTVWPHRPHLIDDDRWSAWPGPWAQVWTGGVVGGPAAWIDPIRVVDQGPVELADEWMADAVTDAVRRRRASFRWCSDCRHAFAPEDMKERNVCWECSRHLHGFFTD